MENFKREIFEQIGNLFYALAADQHVAALESGELKMLLREDWLTDPQHTSTEPVSEASHLIMLTIDTLQTNKETSQNAFDSFAAFYKTHFELFSEALKEKIIETAQAITRIFPSPDRQKNNHLIQLRLLFKNSKLSMAE